MRKKILQLCLAFCFSVLFLLPAAAQQATPPAQKVYDYANLLAAEESRSLNEKMQAAAEKLATDFVLLTTNNTGGRSSRVYADEFYVQGGFGLGDYNGVLMLINMQNREIYIYTDTGSMRHFSDYALDQIIEHITPDLSNGNYARAANRFLSDAENHILYRTLEGGKNPMAVVRDGLLIALGLTGAVMAVLLIMHRRSFAKPPSARRYIDPQGMRVLARTDQFVGTHTTRRVISSDSKSGGSSGGGTSSHSSSSGRSHGGRSGRF